MESTRSAPLDGTPDPAKAHAGGHEIRAHIAGVRIRDLTPILDDRGETCELWTAAWGLGDPPPHVYLATVEAGVAKAWIVHDRQHDRLALVSGRMLVVMYDDRPGSPSRGTVLEVSGGERRRRLVEIPPGVWHGVQNIGTAEAMFVNLPTRPYDYDAPDKRRLPADTDAIPFRFRGASPRSG